MSPRDWIAGGLLGAVVGTVVLGVGSRVAMRGLALLAGQPARFSLGGTTTVVLLGTLCGVVGAFGFVGLQLLLRRRPLVRATLFWTFLLLVTLRGLRPVDARRLLLFVPLVLIYGATLQVLWGRVYGRRVRAAPATLKAGGAQISGDHVT